MIKIYKKKASIWQILYFVYCGFQTFMILFSQMSLFVFCVVLVMWQKGLQRSPQPEPEMQSVKVEIAEIILPAYENEKIKVLHHPTQIYSLNFLIDLIFMNADGPRILAKILLNDGQISSSVLQLIQNYNKHNVNILNMMQIRTELHSLVGIDSLLTACSRQLKYKG